MAMGIVSDSDLNAEIESLKKKPEIIHKDLPVKGRGLGNNEVPDSLRKIISDTALNGTPAKAISEAFGISQSSISAYKADATSTATYHTASPELKKNNNLVRDKIIGKARKRLLSALDNITPEKLATAKLRELTGVSQAMASVLDKVEPKDTEGVKIDKLLIYAPRVRDEQSYEVIEVLE